jgi:hypothetical protein
LFTTWDYHAFVTNRPGDVTEVEPDHRRHAVVEQRIAELKSAGLAHLPSGKFMANAAWLAMTVMVHNLAAPPDTTSRRPPSPPCNDESSPSPATSCAAADANIYGCRPPSPGHTPSSIPS